MKITIENVKEFIESHDLKPKIVCVFLALFLWLYVVSKQIDEVVLSVPVKIKDLPQNLVVSDIEKKRITVVVKGNKDEIKSISIKSIKLFIDLKNPVTDVNKRYPVLMVKPDGYESVDFEPKDRSIFVKVEPLETKRVTIKPLFEDGDSGTVFANLNVNPEFVALSGPKSVIDSISRVETEIVPTGGEASVVQKARLNLAGFPNVRSDVETAEISYTKSSVKECLIITLPVKIKNQKNGYIYKIDDKDVTLFLKKEKEDLLLNKNFAEAYVDVESLGLKEKRGTAKMLMPVKVSSLNQSGIPAYSVDPAFVSVTIERSER